jgi:hypothetical protein
MGTHKIVYIGAVLPQSSGKKNTFCTWSFTQHFSEVMEMLRLVEATGVDNAPFHHWMMEFHIPKFLPAKITQFFSEVMAMLWLVDRIRLDNAPFHCWMTECHIPRFLPVLSTQYFSEVMAGL